MSISSCSSGVERVLGKDEVAGSIPAKSSSSEKQTKQKPAARTIRSGNKQK